MSVNTRMSRQCTSCDADPSLTRAAALAAALGVSIDDLTGHEAAA